MAQADLDSSHTPATVSAQAQSHLPPSGAIENALQARIDAQAFSPLCPSARTSYTRVDFSGANTPRRDFAGIEQDDGDDQDGEDGDAGEGATGEDGSGEDAIPQTPQVSLTFLLVNGRRRTMTFEPETSVGRVKELVWNAWPNGEQTVRFGFPHFSFSFPHGGRRASSKSVRACTCVGTAAMPPSILDVALNTDQWPWTQIGRTNDHLRRRICAYCISGRSCRTRTRLIVCLTCRLRFPSPPHADYMRGRTLVSGKCSLANGCVDHRAPFHSRICAAGRGLAQEETAEHDRAFGVPG